MVRSPVQTLSKQQRGSIRRAAKICVSLSVEQMEAFLAAATPEQMQKGERLGSDITLPDGTHVHLYLSLTVWGHIREPEPELLRIEGPK